MAWGEVGSVAGWSDVVGMGVECCHGCQQDRKDRVVGRGTIGVLNQRSLGDRRPAGMLWYHLPVDAGG